VAQDLHKGYGVIVMSPDQDLMSRIVPYVPEHRLDDVMYFDPSDTTSPIIGFNPLAFEPPDDPVEGVVSWDHRSRVDRRCRVV